MARPGRYDQVKEGEWTSIDRRDNREQCCDCGLVHKIDYRIVEKNGGRNKIEFRCWRDDKATSSIRKRAGIEIIKP